MKVSKYENLTCRHFLEYAKEHKTALEYLPDGKELKRVPRKWLVNVLYSVHGKKFKTWVK